MRDYAQFAEPIRLKLSQDRLLTTELGLIKSCFQAELVGFKYVCHLRPISRYIMRKHQIRDTLHRASFKLRSAGRPDRRVLSPEPHSLSNTQKMFRQLLARGFAESGLKSLCRCHEDVKLICLQRFIRLFAYGATTLHLVAYLELLGFSATRIGLFMALTLVGDTCISLVLTSCADGVGRRLVLALGAALMVASGVAFGLCDSFWILLAAAVFGVISPGYETYFGRLFEYWLVIEHRGNDIGPFRAVEESIVAHLTTAEDRSDVYAWYSLVGAAGTAVGAMASGWTAQSLTSNPGWSDEAAYRAVFYGCSTLGVFKLALVLLLSRDSEAEFEAHDEYETTPILGAERVEPQVETAGWRRKLLPGIQKSSFPVVIPLCLLFALDSFASSLTPRYVNFVY